MSVETGDNRQAIANLAAGIGAKTIVEIGVRRGRLSLLLSQVPTLEKLYLIDSWVADGIATPNQMDKNARQVKRWAQSHVNVAVMHMFSVQAAEKFTPGSIDFLHIDGDHTARGIEGDIRLYMPKVRTGGIISGDDYNLPEVSGAVDRLVPNARLIPNTRIWWAYK